ncbi:hypothetical protein llap_4401 [Limosa lapponica baueri]|uniref:Uncharacterized protein n=1 Tax=Limosa lapponica baueri TaxID=1758121 RepID=A0A2I0UGY3_LIMLA|nr:hypothetical protein llap_4401 [Limosa lapponica baueri]
MVKTMVRQAVRLQPVEVNSGADIHLQPVEDPTQHHMAAALQTTCHKTEPFWIWFEQEQQLLQLQLPPLTAPIEHEIAAKHGRLENMEQHLQ